MNHTYTGIASQYSIKDLEKLSGIKAHTLRIWEQRYCVLQPKRTATNIRYYDSEDLKKVLNIAVLCDHGFRISKICRMEGSEIQEEVLRLSRDYCHYPDQIQSLTVAMIDLDEARFERCMSMNIKRIGLERTMLEIVYPFLKKTGLLWQTGAINPAQEHFITNLIRQKLINTIDGQSQIASPGSKRFVLFLPEGELHEIGLLFASYIIKARNHRVFYLGQSVPAEDLEAVVKIVEPHYLLGIFTHSSMPAQLWQYLDLLTTRFLPERLLLSGSFILSEKDALAGQCQVLETAQDLIDYLKNLPKVDMPGGEAEAKESGLATALANH